MQRSMKFVAFLFHAPDPSAFWISHQILGERSLTADDAASPRLARPLPESDEMNFE